jgi:hypothetical protein
MALGRHGPDARIAWLELAGELVVRTAEMR